VKEFGLKKMWKSPNGTIRNILGGVIFREPIICKNVPRLVPGWTKPIIIGRHAFGDQYRATDFKVPGKGKLTIKFVGEDGKVIEREVFDFPGAASPWHVQPRRFDPRLRPRLASTTASTAATRSISRPRTPSSRPMTAASRTSSRSLRQASSRTSSRQEDHLRAPPDRRHGRSALKWEGGYVWACKNYDGDVQSDTVAQGFGSLGLMTSVLMTPGRQDRRGRGRARHGDPPLPRAPEGQGDLDQPDRLDLRLDRAASRTAPSSTTPDVAKFAETLEKVCVETVEPAT
jgi:isocitrate dehydrogenase